MKYRIFLSEKLDKRWISIYNRTIVYLLSRLFFGEICNGKEKHCRCRCRVCRCFSNQVHGKNWKKDNDVEITLIDRHSYHTMMTELHEVAGDVSSRPQSNMTCNVCFHVRKNVRLVTDTVTAIDKEKKVVQTKQGSYSFDYLILGMGGEPNDFGTPGVKEHGFTLVVIWRFCSHSWTHTKNCC